MRDAFVVRGRQAVGDLDREFYSSANRQRTTVQVLAQRFAFEQLGDDVGGAAVLADVVDGEDVRMVERSRRTGFLFKASQPLRVSGEGSRSF